jgi:hypothetical protein
MAWSTKPRAVTCAWKYDRASSDFLKTKEKPKAGQTLLPIQNGKGCQLRFFALYTSK